MVIYKTVIYVILTLLLILIAFAVLALVVSLDSYFNAKRENLIIASKNIGTETLGYKCEATNKLLSLIDFLIVQEIRETVKTYAQLRQPYPIEKMPDDIKVISNKVYEALKNDIVGNTDIVLSNDYLLSYMIEVSSVTFIKIIQDLNADVRHGI
jgi:hypothetical protein